MKTHSVRKTLHIGAFCPQVLYNSNNVHGNDAEGLAMYDYSSLIHYDGDTAIMAGKMNEHSAQATYSSCSSELFQKPRADPVNAFPLKFLLKTLWNELEHVHWLWVLGCYCSRFELQYIISCKHSFLNHYMQHLKLTQSVSQPWWSDRAVSRKSCCMTNPC